MSSKTIYSQGKLLVDWSAVAWAGTIAGILSLPFLLLLLPSLLDLSVNSIIQYWASMILGQDVITVPATFSIWLLLVAILSHVLLTLILASIIATIFHRFGTLVGVMGGALIGLAYYFINIYSMTYFFNWMFLFEGPVFLLFNMLVGGMTGFFYESLEMEQWDDPKDYNSSIQTSH